MLNPLILSDTQMNFVELEPLNLYANFCMYVNSSGERIHNCHLIFKCVRDSKKIKRVHSHFRVRCDELSPKRGIQP